MLEEVFTLSRLLVTAASCSWRTALAMSWIFSALKLAAAFALLPSGPYRAGSEREAVVVG